MILIKPYKYAPLSVTNLIKITKTTNIINKILVCFSSNTNKNHPANSSENNLSVPKQFLDDQNTLNQKIKNLAQLINKSKYPIFFTGAGVSTSIGIPDYRSGHDTVIGTGPGMWNRTEQELKSLQSQRKKVQSIVDYATPSITHMSIKTLLEKGIFKHLVSQNTDGLHLKSGIAKSQLSELHGNRNLQYCIECGKKYLRDFRTLKQSIKRYKAGEKRSHVTGRRCENCEGQLNDSIIYFGQKLPKQQLMKSFQQGAKSDLCIAIGSSLTVKPSSNVPLYPLKYQKQGKLVIINIQQTPLDGYAQIKISGFCDQIMKKLMDALQIQIQSYTVQRFIQVSYAFDKVKNKFLLEVKGVDQNDDTFSFVKNVMLLNQSMEQRQNNQKAEDQSQTQLKKQQSKATRTTLTEQQQEELKTIELKNIFSFEVDNNIKQHFLKIQFYGQLPSFEIKIKQMLPTTKVNNSQNMMMMLNQIQSSQSSQSSSSSSQSSSSSSQLPTLLGKITFKIKSINYSNWAIMKLIK